MPLTFDQIAEDATKAGLDLRGAFHPLPTDLDAGPVVADGVPWPVDGTPTTLTLLGFVGSARFAGFLASPEHGDAKPHPLDRWSRRIVEGLAATWTGVPLFPFGGPPWHPFQRWAVRAEPVHPSPLGLLIHPVFGLWHSYRGAVLVGEAIALPTRPDIASPCDGCEARPCLSACPVGAYTAAGFALERCAAHLDAPAGEPCMSGGCLARRACPVGTRFGHGRQQATFTMAAFRRSRHA